MKTAEKFKWTGTVSSPLEYPMQVYDGAIIANDFNYGFDAIWGTPNKGWGNSGGIMTRSVEQMELPDSLVFTWYSVVEKQFYSGRWPLNKTEITRLFKTGFKDPFTQKQGTYDLFIIGLAPKGKINLWLSGKSRQVELGSFQAAPLSILQADAYENAQFIFKDDFSDFILNDTITIRPPVRQNIQENGYPDPLVYQQYETRYNWTPKLRIPTGFRLKTIISYTCNGEFLVTDELEAFEKAPMAIPYFISVTLEDAAGKSYQSLIVFTRQNDYLERYYAKGQIVLPLDFDRSEILEAFKTKIDPNKKTELHLQLDPQGQHFAIDLQQDQTVIPLTKHILQNYED